MALTLPSSKQRLTCPSSQGLQTEKFITLDLPPALGLKVLNALKADPRTVDLRALAPQFYKLGSRMLELFDEDEMVDVLTTVSVPSGLQMQCESPLTMSRLSKSVQQRLQTMLTTLEER